MQDASIIANAAGYIGVYRAGDQCLQLTAKGEKLCLTFSGQVVEFERRSEDQFYVRHPDLDLFLLEFSQHDGEVTYPEV